MSDEFQATQDAHWERADPAHFRWTTTDPALAPLEDELLGPAIATLPFPCLEIGCGEGTNLVRLARRGTPVGIDRYPAKARFAARAVPGARVAASDAGQLPFPDGTFRGVLVRDLLHHLPPEHPALAEAVRVLAPGGTLLILEPNGANPLIALQARLVPAEATLRDFGPAPILASLASLPVATPSVEMAQPFPLRRLVLHHRFGLPRLGRVRIVRSGLTALERLAGRLLPKRRWTYAVIRTTRLP